MALVGSLRREAKSNIHLYSTYMGRRGDIQRALVTAGVDRQMRCSP